MTFTRSTSARWQPWDYRRDEWARFDLTDYDVEGRDGQIGIVDEATYEVGGSYLIVDTGPSGRDGKVMLPAGVISGVDHDTRRILVDPTRAQIGGAPEFDEGTASETAYRTALSDYYGEGGAAGWSGSL